MLVLGAPPQQLGSVFAGSPTGANFDARQSFYYSVEQKTNNHEGHEASRRTPWCPFVKPRALCGWMKFLVRNPEAAPMPRQTLARERSLPFLACLRRTSVR